MEIIAGSSEADGFAIRKGDLYYGGHLWINSILYAHWYESRQEANDVMIKLERAMKKDPMEPINFQTIKGQHVDLSKVDIGIYVKQEIR